MNQAAFLKKLSGKKRLEQACKLSDFVRELALHNIKKEKRFSKRAVLEELSIRLGHT